MNDTWTVTGSRTRMFLLTCSGIQREPHHVCIYKLQMLRNNNKQRHIFCIQVLRCPWVSFLYVSKNVSFVEKSSNYSPIRKGSLCSPCTTHSKLYTFLVSYKILRGRLFLTLQLNFVNLIHNPT